MRDDSAMSHLMSAQRGNFHLAGHLRTGGRTPHFFEIGEMCEKKPFKRLICNAKGVMLPSSKTSKHSELLISLSKCAVFRTTALFFNFCVWSQVMVLR